MNYRNKDFRTLGQKDKRTLILEDGKTLGYCAPYDMSFGLLRVRASGKNFGGHYS